MLLFCPAGSWAFPVGVRRGQHRARPCAVCTPVSVLREKQGVVFPCVLVKALTSGPVPPPASLFRMALHVWDTPRYVLRVGRAVISSSLFRIGLMRSSNNS